MTKLTVAKTMAKYTFQNKNSKEFRRKLFLTSTHYLKFETGTKFWKKLSLKFATWRIAFEIFRTSFKRGIPS